MTKQMMDSDTCKLSYQCGSYDANDVTLLVDIVDKDMVANVPVQQKEVLIQSGQQHYSDMLTLESAPSVTHEQLFEQALVMGGERMAMDIARLAMTLHEIFVSQVCQNKPLVLVSLLRAGLPIGVLLQRALSDGGAIYTLPSVHYGVSIIRDRGLDSVAMQEILCRHPDSPVIFVDGWTGKGAIYGELVRSLSVYANPNHRYHGNIFHQNPPLFDDSQSTLLHRVINNGTNVIALLTLADPAGVAWLSASSDDWLIPSGLLGCTVSGLISRTLYTPPSTLSSQQGYHRSILYDNLQEYDRSLSFVQQIDKQRAGIADHTIKRLPTYEYPRYHTQAIIDKLAKQYQVSNINRIKPTIAEATRAILRRDPEQVLLATANHPDTMLLRHLCEQKQLPLQVVGHDILPYQAVTLIKQRQ